MAVHTEDASHAEQVDQGSEWERFAGTVDTAHVAAYDMGRIDRSGTPVGERTGEGQEEASVAVGSLDSLEMAAGPAGELENPYPARPKNLHASRPDTPWVVAYVASLVHVAAWA